MVEMVFKGNVMERHPVKAGIPLGTPVSPMLFEIYMSALMYWVEQIVSRVEQLSVMDDLG